MKMMPMGNSETSKKTDMVSIASMNDDLLHNILSRLPAKSFAFSACVNRFWKSVCDRVFSRPKIISAFSLNPNELRAQEEVIDKVLSEPIRPHFVIANVTYGEEETLSLITERVGSKVPIIVSAVDGILGKEACNDKAGEHKGMYGRDYAILLTIGYLPGMKVDVIPVIQEKGESEASIGDKFVMDIRNYVSVVSDHAAPACLILFGENIHDTETILQKLETILQKLDYAMPAETIIVGDQNDLFVYKRANEVKDVLLHEEVRTVLAGLIFARDRHRPAQAGRIQFDIAISRGLSSVDLRYKAANVIRPLPGWPDTRLTAKRRGEAEVLNGNQIVNDIEESLVGNPSWVDDPYIGVRKQRNYSIGVENKPKSLTSLVFYQVIGGNEEYLSVEGEGIKTGDYFQPYFPDLKVAEASTSDVSSQFRNLKFKPNKPEVIGGFVFAGEGRTDSFFGRPNVDSSPFLENFPELRFGGIFCDGEIGRNLLAKEGEEKKETCIRSCLHVYSSVYLIVTYTSSS